MVQGVPAALEALHPSLHCDICPMPPTSKKLRILIKELKCECISFEIKDESFTAIWRRLFTTGDFFLFFIKRKINMKKATDVYKCVFFPRFVMNGKLKFRQGAIEINDLNLGPLL